MRIIFTGGGTGGHIFPNIAVIEIARFVAQRKKGAFFEPIYVGQKNGMEEKIAREAGVEFYGIHCGKLRRYFDAKNLLDALKVPVGFFEALWILKRLKPDLVFAKGGYVSVPVVLAARALKIPVWMHESDVSPGLANRLCSYFAQKIFLSFEESRKFFPNKHVEVVGNPIREFVTHGNFDEGYKLTGFSKHKPVVLVIGGSTGAQSLNKMVFEILPELLKSAQVVHVTGTHERKRVRFYHEASRVSGTNLERSGSVAHDIATNLHYKQFEFLNQELPHCYAISDLVVSRAGSGSIFEALACEKPMLLVPLSAKASRGDQVENAQAFERRGWAVSVDQDKIMSKELLFHIQALLRSESLRLKMIGNQKTAHFKHAAAKIADAILMSC